MTRTTDTADTDESSEDHDQGDDHTFETDAVFDPETYLPTVEAVLDDERTEREVDFLAERFHPDARLLDAPCGHGRHANRLAERGYDVAGLDRSTAFLDRAREDARERGVLAGETTGGGDRGSVRYREGDLRGLPYDDDAVDGLYNLFTSFGFFDDAGNRRQLAEFARVLRPGGRLVMELSNRDAVLYDYRPASVDHTAVGTVVEERSFDPRTGRNHTERLTVLDPDDAARTDGGRPERGPGPFGPRDPTVGRRRAVPRTDGGRPGPGDRDGDGNENGNERRRVQSATYEVRLYSFTELRALLREAGFEVRAAHGGFEGEDLTLDSTRMTVVAELAG